MTAAKHKILRLLSWKDHLLAPVLCIVYLNIDQIKTEAQIYRLIFFFLTAFTLAAFGYWINDWFDISLDKKAGKKNTLSNLGKIPLFLVASFLLIISLLFWYLSKPTCISSALLFLQIILLIIYSSPFPRLKNHPVLGPICDIHYGHILPVMIGLFYLNPDIILTHTITIIVVYSLLFFIGSRNILLHQIHDRKGDIHSNLQSFPIRYGALFSLHLIYRFLVPAEIILSIVLLILNWPGSEIITYGFCAFIIFYYLNFSGWKFFSLPKRQLKFKFLYFQNDFYEYWLPGLCILTINIPLKYKIILLVIQYIVFFTGTLKFLKDFRKIGINLRIIKAAG